MDYQLPLAGPDPNALKTEPTYDNCSNTTHHKKALPIASAGLDNLSVKPEMPKRHP